MGQSIRNLIDQVPSDGIIRYLDMFNRERIVVTSPKVLAETLVHKSYEFIKPPHFVSGIGRILGVGLLLAEGEEHNVYHQDCKIVPFFAECSMRFNRRNGDTSI